MKKLIVLFLILVLSLSVYPVSAHAFGGYAHWYIGHIKAESYGDTKTDEIKLAYKSGCLLADIGRVNLDISGQESDKYVFISKLYEISRSLNSRSKAMAYGWRDHYTQDWKVSIADANPPALCLSDSGWVDEFLRDKLKPIDFPIRDNEIGDIYVGYTLIKKTYKELYGISLTNDEIDDEIKSMFAAFDLQIAMNTFGWTTTQRNKIVDILQDAANKCVGIKASTPQPIVLKTTQYGVDINKTFDYQIVEKSTLKDDPIDLISKDELNELTKLMCIKKKYLSEDDAVLRISREEIGTYNFALNNIASKKISALSQTEIM